MLYYLYEMNHVAVAPWRAAANATRAFWDTPINPLSSSVLGRTISAGLDVFERMTRRYGKPLFGIESAWVDGERVAVTEETVLQKPFCGLLHFSKEGAKRHQPKLLIVAPMSGHYATLLRGTVETMLQDHDVYITDWVDARTVPLVAGKFDLDDYIDYLIEMLHHLGAGTSIMAVCQPSVPVLAAVSLMSEDKDPCVPAAMILMGGPIDTRRNPTEVNKLASQHDIDWFRNNVISTVPLGNPGFMREVYPGFMQLTGFMTMNLDRHIDAHRALFWHLVQGDGDSADKHDDFYDEYLSVMDLTAEFYLQTVEKVFIRHELPKGEFMHRGRLVRPETITKTALMTVEGERDDISGVGQTEAAHTLCKNIPDDRRVHYLQKGVGHYGVFNGSRFNGQIAPRIAEFVGRSIA
ncbi:poly(3-hydroxybutyrate) depolymerase [Rhodoligotrophos appendicifer]|uniref:polyhydroxyalkanoate depolymerase n=1 Tax=Rhodoligotrophos appendicifer TaxID=987056 RepID=UPI0011809986|nr:polyhydroxyalkanoate depolymerase [Rhodoligotrophos appendicifer]